MRGMMFTTNGGWAVGEFETRCQRYKDVKEVEIKDKKYNIYYNADDESGICTISDFIIGAFTKFFGNAIVTGAGGEDLTDEDVEMLLEKTFVAKSPYRIVLIYK